MRDLCAHATQEHQVWLEGERLRILATSCQAQQWEGDCGEFLELLSQPTTKRTEHGSISAVFSRSLWKFWASGEVRRSFFGSFGQFRICEETRRGVGRSQRHFGCVCRIWCFFWGDLGGTGLLSQRLLRVCGCICHLGTCLGVVNRLGWALVLVGVWRYLVSLMGVHINKKSKF